jgi:hypothetical protein
MPKSKRKNNKEKKGRCGIRLPQTPASSTPSFPSAERSEGAMSHKDRVAKRHNILPFGIFGKPSSNFIQKTAQFRRKHRIAEKWRRKYRMWRAGRNSPLKPPFRPARFIAGFFWNSCYKCKRKTGRKN